MKYRTLTLLLCSLAAPVGCAPDLQVVENDAAASDVAPPDDRAAPPDVVTAPDRPQAPDVALDASTDTAAPFDVSSELPSPPDVLAMDAPPPPPPPPPDVPAPVDVARDVGAPMDVMPPPPDSGPPPPAFTVVFSHRPTDNTQSHEVEDALIGLIRRATPGSRIRVALYHFNRSGPSAELIRARARGVDVRVVLDGGEATSVFSERAALMAGLGADRVTTCTAPGTSCIGTGIMHDKIFLFSALDDGSRDVTAITSHNLTASQLSLHNNLVVVRGDPALFASYERTFNDLRSDVENPNYYRIDDGTLATRAYYFPRASGDTAVSVVDNIACDSTARVRVAMAFFTDARIAVAESLAARRRAGCDVQVVIGDDSIPAGTRVLATLRAAGVGVTLYPARAMGWGLHSKYVVIDAPYAGSTGHRRLVFTGSHNWTGPSLDANDENMLRVVDDAVADAYFADWTHVRASAARP